MPQVVNNTTLSKQKDEVGIGTGSDRAGWEMLLEDTSGELWAPSSCSPNGPSTDGLQRATSLCVRGRGALQCSEGYRQAWWWASLCLCVLSSVCTKARGPMRGCSSRISR